MRIIECLLLSFLISGTVGAQEGMHELLKYSDGNAAVIIHATIGAESHSFILAFEMDGIAIFKQGPGQALFDRSHTLERGLYKLPLPLSINGKQIQLDKFFQIEVENAESKTEIDDVSGIIGVSEIPYDVLYFDLKNGKTLFFDRPREDQEAKHTFSLVRSPSGQYAMGVSHGSILNTWTFNIRLSGSGLIVNRQLLQDLGVPRDETRVKASLPIGVPLKKGGTTAFGDENTVNILQLDGNAIQVDRRRMKLKIFTIIE